MMSIGRGVDMADDYDAQISELKNEITALKLALYAAFNSKDRSLDEALEEARMGMFSTWGEIEHIQRLIERAKVDLQLLGLSPAEEG